MLQKRMHPLKMLQVFISVLKNNAIILFYLFIVRIHETSFLLKYGRIFMILYLVYRMIYIYVEWLTTTYEVKNQQIHLYRGLFKKRHNRVSLATVQNVQRSTPFYFKPFKATSLQLVTSATDERASVSFTAISTEEADRIEKILQRIKSLETEKNVEEKTMAEPIESDHVKPRIEKDLQEVEGGKTIVFQPSRQELFRASFLSLSFLVVIPVLITFFENVSDFIDFDQYISTIYQTIIESWFLIGLTVLGLSILLIGLGMGWTFLNYGKYEISEDEKRIYVQMGLLSERSLSIEKRNIQAIQILQSPIKRWLKLCEVRLISAESVGEEEAKKISSLFPYMQENRAFKIVKDLLPSFSLQKKMKPLPKKALWMKLLRIPWILLLASIYLYVKHKSYLFIPLILFFIVYLLRFFDYRNTRYAIYDDQLQLKKGGLWSTVFVTNRQKIIEIEVRSSWIQQRLELATITVVNQEKPYHYEELEDVPLTFAKQFIHWYETNPQNVYRESP